MPELKKFGVAGKDYENAELAKGDTYTRLDGSFPSTNLACDENPYKDKLKTSKYNLDFGCGVGRNIPWIMENTAATYIGLDPNTTMTKFIWDIQDKTLKIYHYDVKEYLAKKLQIDEPVLKQKKQPEKTEVEIEKPKPLSQEETKDLKRKRNSIQNNIKKFEEKISSLETKISEMDSVIANLDYTDSEKSSSILNEYEKLKKELENVMSYWELEMEALDNLNG